MSIGAARQIGVPVKQTNYAVRVPAPVRGVDTRVSVISEDPGYCIYTYNLVPYDYGMRVRNGYREWAIGTEDTSSLGIRTIIPFINHTTAAKLLFAVTNEGIWDVTTTDVPPVLKLAFTDTSANAGWGTYAHYTDNSGDDALYYADSINGLFAYDAVGGTWAQATGILGPVTANVNFVVLHKQRMWLVEENSSKAWYLPVGSASGQAEEFFFAPKFKHGGNLVGLYNWSVDGGDGADDILVAVSRAGDVLPYKGADPSSADTWALIGTYFIGEVPRGPSIATQQGGELFILSIFGVTSMNDMLKGVNTQDRVDTPGSSSIARRIAERVRQRMLLSIDEYGWDIQLIPCQGGAVIKTPDVNNWEHLQYTYNITSAGWGFWRDVPMNCLESFDGKLVFGTADNRVCLLDVFTDNVKLTPPETGPNGVPIKFSILTTYQGLNEPALVKRAALVRPDFVAGSEPAYTVSARYDYDLNEAFLKAISPDTTQATWDVALWDNAIWATGSLVGYSGTKGTWGAGRYVAVAMVGESRDDTRFVGWDLNFTGGGFMQL